MQQVDGRWVDEGPGSGRPELIESGGPDRVLLGQNRWLVVALLVALAVLGGYLYVEHRPSPRERAAIAVVRAFYAGLAAHDEAAVLATMTAGGTHLGNGALGGDVHPVAGTDLQVHLRALFSAGDFIAELTGPESVSLDPRAIVVSVPNRLSAVLPDGRPLAVTGVSVLSLVDVDGHLKVDQHTWSERGSLGWSRWAGDAVTPVRVCPNTATPDTPGPATQARPALVGSTRGWTPVPPPVVVDSRFGWLVALAPDGTWAFDVCTNTWSQVQTADQSPRSARGSILDPEMVYHAYSGQTVALNGPNPWVYEPFVGWNQLPTPAGITALLDSREWSVVYDPVSGQVLLLDALGDLWAYTVATNTVTPLDVRNPRAPTVDPNAPAAFSVAARLLGYDPVGDQLVLVQLPWDPQLEGEPTAKAHTWVFDRRTGAWTQRATPPTLTGEGAITYDAAAERFLVVSHGTLASYDPATDTWTRIEPGPDWPTSLTSPTRYGAALVYDPVNQRDLLVGGSTETGPADDVWAYTLATNTWTQLLPSHTPTP